MNPITAFANGSSLSPSQVAFLVGGVACVAVLLWGGWSLLSLWRGWAGGRVKQETLVFASVRIVLMIALITWIVT